MITPDVLLETRQIDTATYLANGESPLKSDAYAAMGPCAVRSYFWADIKKRSGDEKTYVRPKRVGIRIWDDYNFRDDDWISNLGGLSGIASQFLGVWANSADGSYIVLQNSDFNAFREKFMHRYNEFLDSRRSGKPRLVCHDFSSFSDYMEVDVASTIEYPLLGLS